MPRLSVPIVFAFTAGGRGGNPAGVVLDAEHLSADDRQRIAAGVGLSETAFVTPARTPRPAAGPGFRVEFFTPTRRIADCGHATVAAFSLLAAQGRIGGGRAVKELADGAAFAVEIDEGGRAFMAQPPPRWETLDDAPPGAGRADALRALGLSPGDLTPGAPVLVSRTGVGGLLVPVRDAATLAGIAPDQAAVCAVSEALDLVEFYVFCRETHAPGRDAGARMFAPHYGIPEESATGMAAGPLACYLHDWGGVRKSRFVIEQGFLMSAPSPSELVAELTLAGDRIAALRVGGRARVGAAVEVEWPAAP